MAAITLIDVYDALEDGHNRQAMQYLEELLHTNPTADAWFLAAEFTLERDRDQAIRHLKRALMLDPRPREHPDHARSTRRIQRYYAVRDG